MGKAGRCGCQVQAPASVKQWVYSSSGHVYVLWWLQTIHQLAFISPYILLEYPHRTDLVWSASPALPNFDRLLIIRDFNIHVCCPPNSFPKHFIILSEAFDLVQLLKGPTQIQGHTLDLVMSHGFSVCDIEICDHSFSDHKPIIFNISLSSNIVKSHVPAYLPWKISGTTSASFSSLFEMFSQSSDLASPDLSPVELLRCFNSARTTILDSVAPLRPKHHKLIPEPWLNSTTCALRHVEWQKENGKRRSFRFHMNF